MTQPRTIHQGATYLLTRRVLHRRFLLRPDAAMTHFILYSLAVAAARYGIEINAFCAMSTHIHMVVTDPRGVLPHFLRCFHQTVAMGTKFLRRWKGAVWDNARASVVQLLTPQAVVEKVAYTLANPVIAGIVEYAHEWPGAKNRIEDIASAKLRVTRPTVCFDPKNANWPAESSIQVKLPPMLAEVGVEEFRSVITTMVVNEEMKAQKKARRKRSAKKHDESLVSPYKRATSAEPERKHNPTFAVGHGNQEAHDAAASALRSFRTAYRRALEQWRKGDRYVQFPEGTWWMREFHAANVETRE
ncbi:MAG: transposase [Polyangiaceae bacterium]|nr:transposase [Polyangiaceae bacterium]